ncbi:MAG: hypothetical protein IVW57_15450, partial [Ktedonobacterales bacterium]|nr:hypothetical protein [Ktedonobacterales bacterium]
LALGMGQLILATTLLITWLVGASAPAIAALALATAALIGARALFAWRHRR